MARTFENRICKLYLVGDSNTQKAFDDNGFSSNLANEYIRKCDVVNRGFSGYTSEYLRLILPQLLEQDNKEYTIHTATLLIGSNDANLKEEDDRHVPCDRYKQNLLYLIKLLKESKIDNIILLSPPPVDGTAWNDYCQKFKDRSTSIKTDDVRPYADICKEVASQQNLIFVDLYYDMLKLEDWKECFHDGLHFSQKGNKFVFEKLKGVLDPIFENLKLFYPDWKTFRKEFSS